MADHAESPQTHRRKERDERLAVADRQREDRAGPDVESVQDAAQRVALVRQEPSAIVPHELLGDGHRSKDNGKLTPFTVKKGDTVIFTSYAGTEIKIDGDTLLIMTEEDILGVID